MAKVTESNSSPYHMGQVQFLPTQFSGAGFSFVLACRIIHTSQSRFFHGNQGTPSPLDTPKPSSHSPSCFPRSRGQPRVALQCAHWPPPLSCEDTWLINFCGLHLSGVGCCLLKNPCNPEGTFPVTNGDKRR